MDHYRSMTLHQLLTEVKSKEKGIVFLEYYSDGSYVIKNMSGEKIIDGGSGKGYSISDICVDIIKYLEPIGLNIKDVRGKSHLLKFDDGLQKVYSDERPSYEYTSDMVAKLLVASGSLGIDEVKLGCSTFAIEDVRKFYHDWLDLMKDYE